MTEACKEVAPLQVGKVEQLAQNDRPYDRILGLAISQGAPLEQLEKWMQLKREHEADEARKAFYRAMSEFKKHPPEILKTAHVKYQTKAGPWVDYWHAELGEICNAIGVALADYDLFARWDMEQPDANTVKTTVILSHSLGHSESLSMSGPPDTSGGKDHLKAVASTNTTLQRLTLLAITGLAAKGMDVDGGNSQKGIEYITEDQQIEIDDLVKEIYDPKPEIFWNFMKVESADKILSRDYNKAITALKKAKEHRGSK